MSYPIRVGDVGATILLTVVDQDGVVIDLSTATLTNALFLRSPSERVIRATPTLVTSGADGKIAYDTVAGDLDRAGQWQAQFRLVDGGASISSQILQMPVEDNLFP